jgi:uncharacterized protein YwqG
MELMNYELPDELAPYAEALADTRRSFIEIIPVGEATTPWGSRFGGHPYLPAGTPYPTTPGGHPLFFLAQINFEEAPALAPYPSKGLLQFFIGDDDLYGMDPEEGGTQHTFKVVYFPDVIKSESGLESDFDFLPAFENTPIYPDQYYGMSFELTDEIAPVEDAAFEKTMGKNFFDQFEDEEQKWDIIQSYGHEVSAEGHKIGGYAHFAQEDPRDPDNPMLLLFQMDSDIEIECNWGDMGTAHFFIAEEDLKKCDFSKVVYHWDCH